MQYLEFMASYVDVMSKLEGLDEKKMSDGDLAYYTDTMLRVNEMLLKILQNKLMSASQ